MKDTMFSNPQSGLRVGGRSTVPARRQTKGKLTDAQRALVEQNLGLVGMLIRRHGDFGIGNYDDAFQIGVIGLMKAATSYDPDRSRFTTYASRCVLNELRMDYRARKSRRNGGGRQPLRLDAILRNADMKPHSLRECVRGDEPGIEEAFCDAELGREAWAILDGMDGVAAQVTRQYYDASCTQAELAKRRGITQPYVSRCIQTTLKKLRREMEARI